jgi:hypothetical protein
MLALASEKQNCATRRGSGCGWNSTKRSRPFFLYCATARQVTANTSANAGQGRWLRERPTATHHAELLKVLEDVLVVAVVVEERRAKQQHIVANLHGATAPSARARTTAARADAHLRCLETLLPHNRVGLALHLVLAAAAALARTLALDHACLLLPLVDAALR